MSVTKFKVYKENIGVDSITTFEPVYHWSFLGAVWDIVKHYFTQKKTCLNVVNTFKIEIVKLG